VVKEPRGVGECHIWCKGFCTLQERGATFEGEEWGGESKGRSPERNGGCVASPSPVKQHHQDSLVGGRSRTEPCVGLSLGRRGNHGQAPGGCAIKTRERKSDTSFTQSSGVHVQEEAYLDVPPRRGDLYHWIHRLSNLRVNVGGSEEKTSVGSIRGKREGFVEAEQAS
jgi:hypothetical protein